MVWELAHVHMDICKVALFQGKVAYQSKERSSFWELQQTKINAYVEEVLTPHFVQMIQFVQECEPLIEQSHTQLLARFRAKRTQIIRSFGAEWKRSIEAVNNEILQSFTNFKNGTIILQVSILVGGFFRAQIYQRT